MLKASNSNWDDCLIPVSLAVISDKGDQVFLQLHEPITTYLLPFLTVEMFLQVILQIKKTEHGLVISRQEVGLWSAQSRTNFMQHAANYMLWTCRTTFSGQKPSCISYLSLDPSTLELCGGGWDWQL